jgi:hypothetical protein
MKVARTVHSGKPDNESVAHFLQFDALNRIQVDECFAVLGRYFDERGHSSITLGFPFFMGGLLSVGWNANVTPHLHLTAGLFLPPLPPTRPN